MGKYLTSAILILALHPNQSIANDKYVSVGLGAAKSYGYNKQIQGLNHSTDNIQAISNFTTELDVTFGYKIHP